MDPITLIVTAIAAGGAVAAKDVAAEAVRDAYAGLKTLVIRKFGASGAVEASVQQIEQNPESEVWQNALSDGLTQAGADADQDVLAQAQALLDLLAELGLYSGPTTTAHVQGSGAIAQDHSVAAGAGGTAVQGDVHGPIITGSGNIIGNVGGDVDMSDRRVEQKGKYNINIDKAEGVSIGDQAQVVQQFGRESRPATPDPAAELELLQEQLQAQKLLLATSRKQLVLASGSEAAKLEVQIGQLEQDIRRAEHRIDELQANKPVNR